MCGHSTADQKPTDRQRSKTSMFIPLNEGLRVPELVSGGRIEASRHCYVATPALPLRLWIDAGNCVAGIVTVSSVRSQRARR